MRPYWLAQQFLTRLPTPTISAPTPREIGLSLLCYPLVGLLIGGLILLLHTLMGSLANPLQAALLLALWVGVTGALHLDGVADMADGWIGGQGDRERTLEIMKDPRCGPVGVVTLVVLLLVKYAALTAVLEGGFWQPLLLAPVLARMAVPLLLLTTPYVRPGGLGETLVKEMPREALAALLLLIGAGIALWSWSALWLVLTVLLAVTIYRNHLITRLGGTTGDTAGGLLELIELLALIVWLITTSG